VLSEVNPCTTCARPDGNSVTVSATSKPVLFNIPYASDPFHTLDHRSFGTWLDDLEDRLGQSLILNVAYAEFGFTPNTPGKREI
jgi:hypothetical protein